jgi:hypothetical protein
MDSIGERRKKKTEKERKRDTDREQLRQRKEGTLHSASAMHCGIQTKEEADRDMGTSRKLR